jgi:hypothetical protein
MLLNIKIENIFKLYAYKYKFYDINAFLYANEYKNGEQTINIFNYI